ncbi:MAG: hypothetical protein M3524_03055 [Actinomycetota bacterium]|nr:hypothetical protein [Actinomycetota bacterium]
MRDAFPLGPNRHGYQLTGMHCAVMVGPLRVDTATVCEGYIDGVSVWADRQGKDVDLSPWKRNEPVTDVARLSLQDPGPEWTEERDLATLPAAERVHIYGWTTKSRWSAPGPGFTVEDLARLRVDAVWFEEYDEGADEWVKTYAAEKDFRAAACRSL